MLFSQKPDVSISPAKLIAAGLLDSIEREALRRSGEHSDQWRAFWESTEATPAEILAEMGTQASLFFTIAGANVEHINTIAQLVGKTAADFLPAETLTVAQPVTFHEDGTVTLS